MVVHRAHVLGPGLGQLLRCIPVAHSINLFRIRFIRRYSVSILPVHFYRIFRASTRAKTTARGCVTPRTASRQSGCLPARCARSRPPHLTHLALRSQVASTDPSSTRRKEQEKHSFQLDCLLGSFDSRSSLIESLSAHGKRSGPQL